MKATPARRDFLKKMGLTGLPFLIPSMPLWAAPEVPYQQAQIGDKDYMVNFALDGKFYSPQGYLRKLQEINTGLEIGEDMYYEGGATAKLEALFARITGKEKAVYLPTGTMANQIAASLLSDDTAKILVPENSHMFRDEADAAQRIHHKRLVPYGGADRVATLEDLKIAEAHTLEGEVFQSGLKTVVVEHPVRRAHGRVVPFEELKKISDYCREKGYKMHLDGARLHLASVYTGIPVGDYAALFDTVYISLYKYLNAGGGAILCGEAALMEKVKHQMKVLGGTMWQSWYNTAMALHYVEGIVERWQQLVKKGARLVEELNTIEGLRITALDGGTNMYQLETGSREMGDRLVANLINNDQLYLQSPDENGRIWLYMNESTLEIPNEELLKAFKRAWIS